MGKFFICDSKAIVVVQVSVDISFDFTTVNGVCNIVSSSISNFVSSVWEDILSEELLLRETCSMRHKRGEEEEEEEEEEKRSSLESTT